MATDKPRTPHFSFSDLDNLEKPEPFVYTTKASKRVTFPDVFDMEAKAAEDFLREMSGSPWNTEVLERWLPEKDFKALMADRLTLRQLTTLFEHVQSHYEGQVGTPGEGNDSDT